MTWQAAGWVALGGAVGSVLRWAVILLSAQRFGVGFPWGTLAVNVVGSFCIGLVAQWATGGVISPTARLFLATGILGGFTTFSAFSLDALLLARDGMPLRALLYVIVSAAFGFLAAYAGTVAGRSMGAH